MVAERHCVGESSNKAILVLSFRYAQIIDDEALEELSYLVEELRNSSVKILFTGLHMGLLEKMKTARYFSQMLEQEASSMYSLHVQ